MTHPDIAGLVRLLRGAPLTDMSASERLPYSRSRRTPTRSAHMSQIHVPPLLYAYDVAARQAATQELFACQLPGIRRDPTLLFVVKMNAGRRSE